MSSSPMYALVIGVTDYPEVPGQDAPGAVNDAVAMAALLGRLGATPARTTVLTSPPRDGSSPATRETLIAALTALIATLRRDPTARGVVFYAGHGATDGAHLLLCPSDTTPTLDRTLSFAEILALVGDEPLPRLTFALDCCFAGAADPADAGAPPALLRTLTRGADATDAAHWRDDLAERVVILSSSGPTQSSYAFSLRPNVDRPAAIHGAFTSGLAAVLQRWSPDDGAPAAPYPIAYHRLVHHLRLYCRALAFAQAPEVVGPHGVEGWLVFRDRPGGIAAPPLPGREITGGTYDSYVGDIHDADGAFVGFYVRKVGAGTTGVAFWKHGYTPSGSSYTVVAATKAICLHGSYTRGAWSQAEASPSTCPEYFDLLKGSAQQPELVGNVIAIPDPAAPPQTFQAWVLVGASLPTYFRIVPGTHEHLASSDRGAVTGTVSATFASASFTGTPTYTIKQPSDAAQATGGLAVSGDGLSWYSGVTTPFSCTTTPIFFSPGTAMSMPYTAVDPRIV